MQNSVLFTVLRKPKYLFLAFFFSLLMLFLYTFLQVLPQGLNNFWFWFSILTPLQLFLYLLYGILSGLNISFFIAQQSQTTCELPNKKAATILGVAGGTLGSATSFCGCFPWIAFVFPISLSFQYSSAIMVVSIFLLLLSLFHFGAFKKLRLSH